MASSSSHEMTTASLLAMVGDWPERRVLTALVVIVVALTVATPLFPDLESVTLLVLPVMLAGWRLSRRSVVILGVIVAIAVAVQVAATPNARTIVAGVVVLVTVAIAYRYASLRERWGLTATQGVGILLDLRDRLRQQGELPESPPGWTVGRALRSAEDDALRGDFTLALSGGARLQVVLVDVSGHGVDVAPRAGLLVGAFGGLLGAVPPERLLPACNDFVCRQGWAHDYATAVHLALDTATGRARVWTAGHPSALVRRADGTWVRAESRGPVLGLRPDPRFDVAEVQLGEGDTLLMLSDGLLDERGDEPLAGVYAAVDGWARADSSPIGPALLTEVARSAEDDQALVLVRRDAVPAASPPTTSGG
jgi:hypothetical protein